jgi:hypothetical protein
MARKAQTRTIHPLPALALAALLGTVATPLRAQAEGAAPPASAPASAAEQTAAPVPGDGAGQAPRMSGQAATAPKGGAEASLPTAGTPSLPPLTPMQAEIRQLLDSEKAAVEQLQSRLGQAVDATQALEIQKQVQDTKFKTQIDILHVQARYARAEGREAIALQIETAIREMIAPKAPGKPIDRPAPAQAPASGAQQH